MWTKYPPQCLFSCIDGIMDWIYFGKRFRLVCHQCIAGYLLHHVVKVVCYAFPQSPIVWTKAFMAMSIWVRSMRFGVFWLRETTVMMACGIGDWNSLVTIDAKHWSVFKHYQTIEAKDSSRTRIWPKGSFWNIRERFAGKAAVKLMNSVSEDVEPRCWAIAETESKWVFLYHRQTQPPTNSGEAKRDFDCRDARYTLWAH